MNFGIEDETLELKKSTGELNEAMCSICAMLNKHGHGTIYFGIHPNGEVLGQEVNESTLRDVSRKIYESIVPQIIPKINKQVIDNKEIIEVTFSGMDKPYSCKGIYYIRTADEDRILPPNELRQLFEYNKNLSWDKELTDYTFNDIDLKSFDKFYKRAVAANRLKETEYNPENILKKLGLIVNDKLTNAAFYLFSSREPIVLKMAVFATEEKLTFLDINRIKGNIIDLIDRASEYVKERMMWRAEIVDMKRVEKPEIPLSALREIICNSFAHARYNSSTEHEIDIHPDKIVIYNPGSFPYGYNPEDFVNDNLQSMVRNPLILDTLYLSEDVEAYSSGLKHVYNDCKDENVEIDYNKYTEGFAFVFKRKALRTIFGKAVPLNSDEREIIRCMGNNPNVSIDEIENCVSKSRSTIQRIINRLRDDGYITRIGGTRGYWHVERTF